MVSDETIQELQRRTAFPRRWLGIDGPDAECLNWLPMRLRSRRAMREKVTVQHQAGVLAYRLADGKVVVLLLTSRETGRFVIPKGNIGQGLSPRDAGAKEAFEEGGIVGTFDGDMPVGFFTYQKRNADGSISSTTVEVYALRVDRQKKHWPEKKERQLAWVSPKRAAKLVDEPSLAKLFLRFAEIKMAVRARIID
jgi:8-oxo-dGTP pyrophosphatase MutT (NUDIX family)